MSVEQDRPRSDDASIIGDASLKGSIDAITTAFPEIAAALRLRVDRILKAWRSHALRAMPHLNRMSLSEFENETARILRSVADALQSDRSDRMHGLLDEAPKHGVDRFGHHTSLTDYFEEGSILRAVIIVELGDALARPISASEAAQFHAIFDIMVQQGTVALARKQREKLENADAALQESQRFLRSSLDALAGSIAVIDESGTILDVNESWRRFATENRFVGAAFGVGSNYLIPCDKAESKDIQGSAISEGIRDVIAGRRAYFETEYPCHSPTEQRWFLMRVTRFNGVGPTRLIVAHDNITKRKQAENARQEMADRFAEHSRIFDRVLSSITDFAYTFDLEGRFTFANKPLLDLWGISLSDAVGKTFSDLQYPADLAERLQNEIREVVETGKRIVGETPYESPAGKTGIYQYIFSAVLNADGEVEAVAGSTRDVTEQKRVEEELRLSVAEQERLLESERRSRDSAEQASRAKDKFLAVLSHELRTPLTPVVMTVAALELNADLPITVRDDLKMIRRNVELESKLIDVLLDISKIISGKLSLRFDILDINDLVSHVCSMCRSNVREKGIHLYTDLGENVHAIVGDSARLHQVFWNLLTNATKFTPEGGDIYISTEAASAHLVQVTIRDTGIGIPEDVLPRIFEAFEQGDSRVTKNFGGLGLGLAISKALIDQHRGIIRAETKGPGKGSTFTVELPAISAEEIKRVGSDTPPSRIGDIQSLRLLVVEDHSDTATVLARLLKASGHSVKTAGSVADALKLASVHDFDILISDLGLPDATGYELMRQIKAKYGTKGIAMSGYGMEEDLAKSESAGFSDHIVKPVNYSELEQSIRRLGSRSSHDVPPHRH